MRAFQEKNIKSLSPRVAGEIIIAPRRGARRTYERNAFMNDSPPQQQIPLNHDDPLKKELVGLFQYVQRVRMEIAAIGRPADADNKFESMGEQLDAIVGATEEATNNIMETMERNGELLDKLREGISDAGQLALIDQITDNTNSVFEACSFQDITGQRVSKVIKSVTYVEDRVQALVNIWGKSEVDGVEVEPDREKTEDEKLLAGPALEGEGISQEEIDKLFD